MTMITGSGLEWYAWKVRASAIDLEIKLRPLGARSAMLRHAWPGIAEALGMSRATKMTIKQLTRASALAHAKAAELELLIKPGDITP